MGFRKLQKLLCHRETLIKGKLSNIIDYKVLTNTVRQSLILIKCLMFKCTNNKTSVFITQVSRYPTNFIIQPFPSCNNPHFYPSPFLCPPLLSSLPCSYNKGAQTLQISSSDLLQQRGDPCGIRLTNRRPKPLWAHRPRDKDSLGLYSALAGISGCLCQD